MNERSHNGAIERGRDRNLSTDPFLLISGKTRNELLEQFQLEDHGMKLLCEPFPLMNKTRNNYSS